MPSKIKHSGNVGITTTIITGINTHRVFVGQDVRYQSGATNGVAWDTQVADLGIGTVYLNRETTNSSTGTGVVYKFGYYDHERTQRFFGIPTLGISNDGEYLLPPRLTTTQRDTMSDSTYGTDDADDFDGGDGKGGGGYGAIIYNVTTDRLEVFLKGDGTGGGWAGIATVT